MHLLLEKLLGICYYCKEYYWFFVEKTSVKQSIKKQVWIHNYQMNNNNKITQ